MCVLATAKAGCRLLREVAMQCGAHAPLLACATARNHVLLQAAMLSHAPLPPPPAALGAAAAGRRGAGPRSQSACVCTGHACVAAAFDCICNCRARHSKAAASQAADVNSRVCALALARRVVLAAGARGAPLLLPLHPDIQACGGCRGCGVRFKARRALLARAAARRKQRGTRAARRAAAGAGPATLGPA